jgi:hypothetical protein
LTRTQARQRRLHVEALSEIGSLSDVTIGIIAAVYTVLYDRHAKRVHDGLELPHSTGGDFEEPDHMADAVGITWGG